MHEIHAFDESHIKLFIRYARNKVEVRKLVLNHPMLHRIAFVLFKNRKYTMTDIYGGMKNGE